MICVRHSQRGGKKESRLDEQQPCVLTHLVYINYHYYGRLISLSQPADSGVNRNAGVGLSDALRLIFIIKLGFNYLICSCTTLYAVSNGGCAILTLILRQISEFYK